MHGMHIPANCAQNSAGITLDKRVVFVFPLDMSLRNEKRLAGSKAAHSNDWDNLQLPQLLKK
jgi:hypothetical protein